MVGRLPKGRDLDWTAGTALLVSDRSIKGDFVDIEASCLDTIVGSSGYSCTNLLQDDLTVYCEKIGGLCDGYFEIYYERWGCEAAPSGSCPRLRLMRLTASPCIEHHTDPDACMITGEWTTYYMWACD